MASGLFGRLDRERFAVTQEWTRRSRKTPYVIYVVTTLEKLWAAIASPELKAVFIADVRHGDRFVQIRREMFPKENFSASALITVSGFARPGMLIAIQGIAVIGGK